MHNQRIFPGRGAARGDSGRRITVEAQQATRRLALPSTEQQPLERLDRPAAGLRNPATLPPHSRFSNASGQVVTICPRITSSTNRFSEQASGGTVAKILPETRNDVAAWCGCSVAAGSARA